MGCTYSMSRAFQIVFLACLPALVAAETNLDDAGLGFGLVCAAGGATMVGAALVFFPQIVALANESFLAGCLAIAAGVMVYVSLVEIFVKSVESFGAEGAKEEEKYAYLYGTLSLFAGCIINFLLGVLTDMLEGETALEPEDNKATTENPVAPDGTTLNLEAPEKVEEGRANEGCGSTDGCGSTGGSGRGHGTGVIGIDHAPQEAQRDPAVQKALLKMGVKTALAIGIHNFPEGLATFIATLDDPSVGVSLAIAIAVHNIPEGLCVAMPVYYATGSRLKAFFWAFLSGISEPIGAGIGWAVLYNTMDDYVYGVIFGIVGGMMVHISIKELIPTAIQYDKSGWITHVFFTIGMAVMALSLVLFKF